MKPSESRQNNLSPGSQVRKIGADMLVKIARQLFYTILNQILVKIARQSFYTILNQMLVKIARQLFYTILKPNVS